MTGTSSGGVRLDGRVAFVTGGSRGLGRAIAQSLGEAGSQVVIGYVDGVDAAKRAVEDLSALGCVASAVQADLRDPAALRAAFDEVRDRHGRLDVFVHNAATFVPMSALAADADPFFAEQRLALLPLLAAAPALAELMPPGGRIVAISGNGATSVVPGYVATGVAKAALESLVRYLAVEFGPRGVTVNAVATGLLDKGPDTSNPQIAGFLGARTPNGRLTTPADVADVVTLLCLPQARWLQGQVLTADGGLGLLA